MQKKLLQILIILILSFSMIIFSETVILAGYNTSQNTVNRAVTPPLKLTFSEIGCNEPLEILPTTEKLSKDNLILKDCNSKLAFIHGNEVSEITFEDYLIGVVISEIPYTYNYEAIKAQVVAARTYALYILNSESRDANNTLCSDSSHCSGYLTQEEFINKYGENAYNKAYTTIKRAVNDTDGEVVLYNDEICCTVYHASSYGKTENSYNLWKTEIPYLKSVITPETADKSQIKIDKNKMAEFIAKYGQANSNYSIIDQIYNDSGRCDSITIAGITVKADKFRNYFGLKSCDFRIQYIDNSYVVTTYGYGHGIGLSQVGANELAKQGKSYKEILEHYYTGVTVSKY